MSPLSTMDDPSPPLPDPYALSGDAAAAAARGSAFAPPGPSRGLLALPLPPRLAAFNATHRLTVGLTALSMLLSGQDAQANGQSRGG